MPIPTPNSSTGGYLPPATSSPPLEGAALLDFVQAVLVGVSGLSGPMVRPSWLAVPSNIPDVGTAWCSFSILNRPSDTFAFVEHDPDGNAGEGVDKLQRQEEVNVLARFYDLGSTGLADMYAARTRDGFAIPQNLEVLLANGWAFVSAGEPTPVPVLAAERWQYRVDLPLVFRRQIDRQYNILNIESAEVSVTAQSGTDTAIINDIIVS